MHKLLALFVLFLPTVGLAQEATDAPVSDAAQLGLSIYEMLLPVLLAGLTWLGAHLSAWIKSKTKNEALAGILVRLNQSVFDGVKAVNQNMANLLGEAKAPGSPGGAKITEAEAAKLKAAALDHVKSYWGAKGLGEMAKVLGFGGDMAGLDKMLSNKIEAAVGDVKAKALDPK